MMARRNLKNLNMFSMSIVPKTVKVYSRALSLVLSVSRICGIAPLQFVKVRDGYQINLSTGMNKYGYVLITVMNLITIGSVIADFLLDPRHSVRGMTTARRVVWILDVGIMTIIAFTSAFGAPKRMKSIINILKQLQNIDKELMTYKWTEPSEKNKYLLFVVWSLVTVSIMLLDHFKLLQATNLEYTQLIIVNMYLCYFYCYWINHLIQMQFMMLATLVKSSFGALNEQLKRIINVSTMQSQQIYLPIHSICKNYAAICEVMRLLDRSFGFIILLLLLSYLLHLIISPYYLFCNLIESPANTMSYFTTALQFMWCIFHVLSLIMLIEPSHSTSVEMDKTKELVSQLMISPDLINPLSLEIEIFFRQLLLNQVTYSPMKVTTLTRTLVATILGSITTYLVVIMQL